jgi:hypothetical protein
MGSLSELIEYHGPNSFSVMELAAERDLFSERAALFYTPTQNIPSAWVGSGPLDMVLPIPTPSYYEYFELRGYRTPRLWVDLLQRATGKLRWLPIERPHLTLIRYDSVELPDHARIGAKALVDALKVCTTGRGDGRLLHYFGAILDDGPNDLVSSDFFQERVSYPSMGHTLIIVE